MGASLGRRDKKIGQGEGTGKGLGTEAYLKQHQVWQSVCFCPRLPSLASNKAAATTNVSNNFKTSVATSCFKIKILTEP